MSNIYNYSNLSKFTLKLNVHLLINPLLLKLAEGSPPLISIEDWISIELPTCHPGAELS